MGAELQRLYHHIFLPPQLPQASDDAAGVDLQLIDLTLAALGEIQQPTPTNRPLQLTAPLLPYKI
jgi:hypothetical protein